MSAHLNRIDSINRHPENIRMERARAYAATLRCTPEDFDREVLAELKTETRAPDFYSGMQRNVTAQAIRKALAETPDSVALNEAIEEIGRVAHEIGQATKFPLVITSAAIGLLLAVGLAFASDFR